MVPGGCSTWTELVERQVAADPDAVVYEFLTDGETVGDSLTRGALAGRARAVAERLGAEGIRPGDRVLLVYPPGLEFVVAFHGCVFAGVIAVPVYPPSRGRPLDALERIVADCGATGLLTIGRLELPPDSPLGRLRVVPTDRLGTSDGPLHPARGSDVVFLQYTSGSTGHPRGVVLDHTNLLYNESVIYRAFGHGDDTVVLGWLPVYHDMGLIGNALQPMYAGGRCVLFSPGQFLERPMRWLRAIARHGATTSGGPNFAYDLCVRHYDGEALADLDLSRWRIAYNGAEPVRADTLDRFARTFAPHGFRSSSLTPCYGLAEATLMVSGAVAGSGGSRVRVQRDSLERGRVALCDDGVPLVSCGEVWADVAVVRPISGTRADPDEVGEIWVRGPSVSRGYFGRPDETFGASLSDEPDLLWLRTGDLGFLHGEELFVTGRSKDLIIHRGRNLYPQDLEHTAEGAHPQIRPGCTAAIEVDQDDGIGVVLVAEIRDPGSAVETAIAIRRAVAREHDLPLLDVVLVGSRTLPKTSSGKIRRRKTRDDYLSGALSSAWSDRGTDRPVPAPLAVGPVHAAIHTIFRSVLGVDDLDLDESFAVLGGDSLRAAQIVARVSDRFGSAPPTDRLTTFSVRALAEVVEGQLADRVAALSDDEVAEMLARLESTP